ncbi:AIG2 family protein [Halospina denitrificans]|uniref:AIG2 family protein n=1 Tax=Halospina denitrificans TaxID=332522 RepID=A0A4R7JRM5_9GAMM|nr:gamma-glutamylcyclotransferase family protein [Halospina denitrificans]TDT40396.1 AIG2 family protein [Halospina denitrificans]
MLCFSYGSNMSQRRLQARVPSARFVAVAELPEHRMVFHKRSRADGSAKCDAEYTGQSGDRVIGIVWDIAASEKGDLDRVEGLGYGYAEKMVEVITGQGERLNTQIYVATDIDPTLTPYRWYWEHVRIGARENRFPAEYTAWIESVSVAEDPEAERHQQELSIYTRSELFPE